MNRYLLPAAATLALWASSAVAADNKVCEIQPGLVLPAKRVDLQRSTTPWQCSLSRIVSDKSLEDLKKDEFETTKAFQARVAKVFSAPVGGYDLSKPITLAVWAHGFELKYDADTEALTLDSRKDAVFDKLSPAISLSSEPDGNLAIPVTYILENGYSYDTNLMASNPRIRPGSLNTEAAVIVHAPQEYKIQNVYDSRKNKILIAKVPPEAAKAIKEHLYMLVSGTVSTSKPYTSIYDDGNQSLKGEARRDYRAIYFQPGASYAFVRGDTGDVLLSGSLK